MYAFYNAQLLCFSQFYGYNCITIFNILLQELDCDVFLKVVRAAESCAATMAGVLPPEMVVRVLNPIIKTGDFPVNQVIRSPVSQLTCERIIF